MIVASFYTENYAPYATSLVASCVKFGLLHQVLPSPSLGHWWYNVQMKPQYIYDLMRWRDRDVLWIDADIWLREDPTSLLNEDVADITGIIRPVLEREANPHHLATFLLTGVVLYRYSHAMLEFLADWGEGCLRLCDKGPDRFNTGGGQEPLLMNTLLSRHKDLSYRALEPRHLFNPRARRTVRACHRRAPVHSLDDSTFVMHSPPNRISGRSPAPKIKEPLVFNHGDLGPHQHIPSATRSPATT